MDLNQPKPRINASMLAACDGKVVTLLGKVKSVDNDGINIVVESSDKVDVHVTMQDPIQELLQGLIEVHGTVQQNRVQGLNYVLFAPENEQTFDMEKYNQAVQYMQQLPDHYLQGASVQEAA